MSTFSIDNFGCARKINNSVFETTAVDARELNAIAAERGYIVHPDCCTEEVKEWLDNQARNYNATFYKGWNDVTSRDRVELLIDQLIHYATTYGTGMQGTPYVPNENFDAETAKLNVPAFKELKLITPIDEADLYKKCCEALYSGIALKAQTLADYVEFIDEYLDRNDAELDIDSIKNREAICMLCSKLGTFPSDPVMALRTLVYTATKDSSMVQNDELIEKIKHGEAVDLTQLDDDEIRAFAAIFNRFKRVFLAFKANNEENAAVVNRIGHLSKTLHEPMVKGFWESILEEEKSAGEIAAQLMRVNNFKKVRIMQLALERMNPTVNQVYTIRNGKAFVRMGYTPKAVSEGYCRMLYGMCRESLVESLKGKACSIRLPRNCELAMPSSEKTFVGNIPFGSCVKLAENNIVGIYWRNEWGTRDFDLSLLDFQGYKIGWNAAYGEGNGDVIYSGDMTNADPEATELVYMSKAAPDSIVCVNRFNGAAGSKFRLFFAQENLSDKGNLYNYMVDPNSIRWDVMMESENAQQTLGLICDNSFYVMDMKMGDARVSYNGVRQLAFIETMRARTRHFVKLADILVDAGFTVVDDANATVDIDFNDLKKDSIIRLMA